MSNALLGANNNCVCETRDVHRIRPPLRGEQCGGHGWRDGGGEGRAGPDLLRAELREGNVRELIPESSARFSVWEPDDRRTFVTSLRDQGEAGSIPEQETYGGGSGGSPERRPGPLPA
jgi:hypothetical protein